MPTTGEIEGAGRDRGIEIPAGQGVALRAGATPANMPVVAAVATGAAEALGLQLEPAVRLQTIAVEAAGNVVAHGYPESLAGPLQVEICREDGWSGDERQSCVHVKVRDRGVGVQIPPGAGEHPSLGLSMVSSLAESFELESGVAGGTYLDATIVPDAAPSERHEAAGLKSNGVCELEFADEAFMQPILGRALAAQVSGAGIDLDRLEETIHVGDVIAERLSELNHPGNAVLRFSQDSPGRLTVRAGPFEPAAVESLVAAVRVALGSRIEGLDLASEPSEGEGAAMRVSLPV